ncbi:MAG: PAS domain S-box protein [Solirubrobacterales bacterium]
MRERPAAQVIAVAAALFAIVFAARLLDDDPAIGVHLFYIIPVILLALRFGVRGGLIGAVIALILFAVWSQLHDAHPDYETWLSPAFTVLMVGLLVGYLSQSLMRSERRFRSAAENQLEPFVLYAPVRDETGEIVDFRAEFINAAGAESVGLPAEELTGKLLSELFPGRLESGLLAQYIHVVETGEPYFRETSDYLNVLGEVTLVRTFDIRVARLEDGSGMIETTWRDITDKRRAELDRDWLASIVEQASDAILSVDCDKRIVSWSPAAEELYGYSREEVVGKHFKFLIEDAELAERNAYLDRVLAGERPGPMEVTERCKDGSRVRISFIAWPILDADGEVIGAARINRRLPR